MNQVCERPYVEERIFDRTEAVFKYFGCRLRLIRWPGNDEDCECRQQ